MLKKIYLLLSTVRHLKVKQISHQLKYRLIKPKSLNFYSREYQAGKINYLEFSESPPVDAAFSDNNTFKFLNQQVSFGSEINWNFQGNGKLWNYNLQYCNYLLQPDVDLNVRIDLLSSLYSWLGSGKLPMEPYPASLRSINVIRLICRHRMVEPGILDNLHAELVFLSQRPEYHLLGNHLLENAFAIIMGGGFFLDEDWIQQGVSILKAELDEQILSDGAHFELSPMYHQIIFYRLLELIDWYSSFSKKDKEFEKLIRSKAAMMYSWLENMTFSNGDIPHFNDSAIGIAYPTKWLIEYANSLGIRGSQNAKLSASGYRAFKMRNYECVVDAAAIGPTYQPGHGHADALSFILYKNGNPLFVEKGTSTYQIGERRSDERSTSAHNTVVVGNINQSEVWGGFRVGNRANASINRDEECILSVRHDGYKHIDVVHQRTFQFLPDRVIIEDNLVGWAGQDAAAYFYIHPDVPVELNGELIILGDYGSIEFTGADDIAVEGYQMAEGYNNYLLGTRVIVKFAADLKTNIHFL